MELLKLLSVFFLLLYVYARANGEKVVVGADSDVIRREAISLLLRTEHTQPGERERIFPGLANFVCSGNITSILFIAERSSRVEASVSITFSLWQPMPSEKQDVFSAQPQDSYEVTDQDVEMVSLKGDIAIYRANLQPPLQFQSGDVLGIDQGQSPQQFAIQYAYGWGPENYVLAVKSLSDSGEVLSASFHRGPVAVQDYPLLAMLCESCVSTCVEGLLSPQDLDTFLNENSNPKVISPFLWNAGISPLLGFTDDGSITRWAVNKRVMATNQLPELQIFRAKYDSINRRITYLRVGDSSTDIENSDLDFQLNTKTFINQEISFRKGDILAVSYHISRVVLGEILLSSDTYESSGFKPGEEAEPAYDHDVVEISLFIDLDSSGEAVETPSSSQSAVEPVVTTPTSSHPDPMLQSNEYPVVPQFVIKRSGLLSRWVFAARLSTTLLVQNTLQLQVWRKTQNMFLDTLKLVYSTSLQQEPSRGSSLGTYEYVLETPAEVEVGDILGFYQPTSNDSQLSLVLLNSTDTLVYKLSLLHTDPVLLAVNDSESVRGLLPLMSAEIIESDFTTSSPTPDKTDSVLNRNEIIIIAGVGGAVLIIGAMLIIIIILYCCRKRSHKVKIRSRSSIYLTAQGSRSSGKFNGMVYLRSHQHTPFIDFNPIIFKKPLEIDGDSVRFSGQHHDADELKM